MLEFPRTNVGGLSLSRMVVGTNWFLGFSHQTAARDRFIQQYHSTPKSIADVLEVFLAAGVDAVMGLFSRPLLAQACLEAEQRTGRRIIRVDTPGLAFAADGTLNLDETARILDQSAAVGADVCMPHQGTTDRLLDRTIRRIRQMDIVCRMIRERGMIPGLSTHMPETPIYADESGLDVATYIQIYNAIGFLMQIEVDWVHRMIHKCAKPVMTIKPMAAGRLPPLQGLAFVWATLREIDMVTVGCLTTDEAKEVIEISLCLLAGRAPEVELQRTRSKELVERRQ